MGACVPFEMRNDVTGLIPREGIGCCCCVVLICSDYYYSSLKVSNHASLKDRFEIQITVVVQGGIKFFFLKIFKISKYLKNLKTKKNQIYAQKPLLEDYFKIIEFLENEKGTLRSTF
jgi:hypothetical protein